VGDPGENSVSPGAAYLFDGSNGKLLHTFRNPRPDRNDAFGCCVAPLGNDVLICDCDHEFAGAVYLFKGVGKPGPGAAD
jgi:hypothetical protein